MRSYQACSHHGLKIKEAIPSVSVGGKELGSLLSDKPVQSQVGTLLTHDPEGFGFLIVLVLHTCSHRPPHRRPVPPDVADTEVGLPTSVAFLTAQTRKLRA
jgi:hypothetical protein